jgi:broad specificity phosphatase PhoE
VPLLVHLIRHGETTRNAERGLPLNDVTWEQIRQLLRDAAQLG